MIEQVKGFSYSTSLLGTSPSLHVAAEEEFSEIHENMAFLLFFH